nr:Calx-beta domain-containing protein [Synechococcus sp. FACHB-909]
MGERDIYTFTGTAGQRLYYDALTSDFTRSFPVRLIDPTGDIGLLNQQHYFDSNTPFTLTETGTYQLQLESTSSFSLDTGAYSFQLLDLAAATVLPFDTVTNGTLSPGQDTDLYRFNGTAGQRLVFDSQTPGFPSVSWRLFGPGNQSLANQNITSDLDLTLSADGTYVLAIDGASATNVNYSFSLVTPTTSTTALSLNSPVSSSLAEIGERDIYTFTGSVGQRLYYDALTNDTSKSFPVRLIDPTGDIVFLNQQHYADSNTPFTLTEAGTYQLLVESTATFSLDSGAYSFQLLDVAAATALNFDTVTNGTLSPGQDTDLYRFTGTAGQRLVFDSLTPGFPSAAWRLFGPTNQSLVNQNITTDLELNLTADGTYILAIDGASATSVNYSFNLITPTSARTGAPNIIVADRTGNTNTPIPLNIAASFAASDGNDQRSILISGVPSGALLSAGTNNNNGTWTLTPAQLAGLTITVANAANFALTVTATSAETTGDTATTTATFSVIVNVATGITVTPTSGLVTTEAGGSATFTVVLDSQPTANVTVGIASSDATEGSTNVSSLTFTPANWNVAQTVIVTGVDDPAIDGTVAYSIVTAAATSSDPNYNGFNAANVSVSNTDNDTAGVTVAPTGGLFTSEGGGTAGFSVRLTSQPSANVSISIASSDSTEGSTNASSITFTPANWNVFQFVTVTGVDEGVVDGNIVYTILTGATTSTDTNYSGLAVADVGVTNVDNDAASFSISDVSITEGNSGTTTAVFTVTLSNAVAGGASVSYATANGTAIAGTDYVATSGTLNFTGTAGEQRTVSVTINGDTTIESDEFFVLNLSSPTNGVTLADTQGVGTITNDDAAPVPVVTLAVSPGSVTENGVTNLVYTFSRTGDTTNSLVVNYSIGGTATGGTDYGLIPASVTFAAGSATASVTVDPTGDTQLEPNETVALTLTADPAYTIGTAGAVTGTITNDDAASFSISDVSITEGNSGTTTAVFTVTLSNAVAGGASVNYATADGTATAGSDYLAASGTLNFAGTPGETQTVSVTINGDTAFEPNESFFLNLSAPTNGVTIADSQGLGTITNDDAAPLPVVTLAVSPASVTENGTTNLVYTFTRTGATTNPLTVNYAINGTATNGTDYGLIPTSVTFAAGSATATVTVDPTADAILEPDETVSLTLTADPAYVVGTTTTITGTIANDDAASLSISDVSLTEGDAGTKIAVFTVTLNQAVAGGTSVTYATANGTATAGSDYVATSGTLNFTGTSGETQTISVTINGESRVELNETFFLNLSTPTNGVTLADGQGLGTITNDDTASLSINNVSRVEGNSGITSFVFDVTLNNAVDVPLSVGYATANGTATLANNDYQAANGTLNFVGTASETQQITVNALGDTTVEANETFVVNLSNLQASGRNVTLANAQATGTITNDDGASFSINDVSVTESNSGTKTAVFSVTLNNAVSGGSSVSYATANGTATAGSDYLATSGTLTFAGTAGETQTISVTINGDTAFEPDETFFLNLSAPTNGVTIADSQGLGTITNDDPAPLPVVTLAVSPASVTENGATNLIYTFTRTGATTNPLTVNYAINGTASNGTDYGLIPASVTFAAGSATASVTVDPTADAILEPNETVSLTLTADPAYVVGTTTAVTGTITNDDAASFSISDVSISEGNSGTKTAVFTVSLSQAVAGGASVSYATANGTATAGSDYLAASGTLTFTGTAGETQTVSVTINGDTTFEPDETFFLNLSAPTNGVTIADSQGLATITNDDPAPLPVVTLALSPASVTENGTTNLVYTFTRTGATTNPLTVNYAINGTATNGTDYGLIPTSVTFAAGSATATVTVDPTGDSDVEPDETVSLTLLANAAYAISNTGAVTGTITNDDVGNRAPVFVADPAKTIRPGQTATFTGASLVANDTDPDGNPLSVSQFFTATSQGGSVANTGFDTFTYTPAAGFTGTDIFSYVVSDGAGGFTNATLAINIVNSAPVFVADPAITIRPGQTATINGATLLGNDTDPNGDPLSISQFFTATSQGGSVANTAFDTFTYTPAAGFTGTDTFSYVISDGFGGFTNATLAINVVNSAPVFVADPAITIQPGQTATIIGANLLANDTDPNGDPLSVSQFFANTSQGGSVANTAFDTFTYTPSAGFTGTDTFSYVISDGFGGFTNASLAINVQAKPRVSLAVSPASVAENGATNLIYTFSRTGATTNPLTVNYTVNGTATNGSDYGLIGNSVTFAAGSATATVTVDPTGDSVVESDETVSLTLLADAAYTVGTAGAVTGTITNDDAGQVINGTRNRETLTGTDGDDVITGRQGADTIRGNGGADRFVYTSIVDAGDTIIDFNRAQGDKVDLKGALASVGYTGTTPITDGYLRFVGRGSDTLLQIDPDGSGLAAARNFILFKNVDLATLSQPDNFIV